MQNPDNYTISCRVADCPCEKRVSYCPRGFFSLFVQAVYGIEFAQRCGMSYYVDYGNCMYLYTDPNMQDRNFWNYYFYQDHPNSACTSNSRKNSFEEVYPHRIWSRRHFLKMNRKVVGKIRFKEEIEVKLRDKRDYFRQHKVLGVQVRRTDHREEVKQVSMDLIWKNIDRRISNFDKLLVATDDSNVLELLKERYGEKLIYNNVYRSDNEEAVHSNLRIENRYKLGEEALIDCYCLSLCRHTILLQSNLSYAALLFNPLQSYTLLESGGIVLKLKRKIRYYLGKAVLWNYLAGKGSNSTR